MTTIHSAHPVGFQLVTPDVLDAVAAHLAAELQPERIVLFGSYAYGVPTPDSDVDLLIVMETDARPAERYTAVSNLLRPRPFPVDILVHTPREVDGLMAGGDSFMREVFARGHVLYERPH